MSGKNPNIEVRMTMTLPVRGEGTFLQRQGFSSLHRLPCGSLRPTALLSLAAFWIFPLLP